MTYLEILSAEQPCILCAQVLEVVTVTRDTITNEERTERTRLDHNDVTCREMIELYREQFPFVMEVYKCPGQSSSAT